MTTVLHTFCLAVGLVILLHKVVTRGPFDAAAVAFCCYVGLSALSYLVLLPPVYVLVDGWTGMANSAGLVSGVSVLGLIVAQQYLLLHWTYPPPVARQKVRRRFTVAALMFVAYVVTYFVFEPRQQRFDDFYLRYTHQLTEAPYLVIYILACVIGEIDVVRHCLRYAHVANPGWLRRGMLTTALGGAVILVYCVVRVADLVAGPLGGDLRGLEPLAWLCGDVGSMLALIGWAMPTVGPAVVKWSRDYRAYRRLYPLWRALYREVPAIALDPPPSALRDSLRWRDIDFWLHRRVIEIQDARRALRSRAGVPSALTEALAAGPNDPDAELTWLTRLADEVARPGHRSPRP